MSPSASLSASGVNESQFSGVPRGYQEQVSRLRNAQMERNAIDDLIRRKMRGEEYNRVKLANMKPPSFHEPARRRLLFYVDVNITPIK